MPTSNDIQTQTDSPYEISQGETTDQTTSISACSPGWINASHNSYYIGEYTPLDIDLDAGEVNQCNSCSSLNLNCDLLVCSICFLNICTDCHHTIGKWIHNPLMCNRCSHSNSSPHTLYFACTSECEHLLKVMYL